MKQWTQRIQRHLHAKLYIYISFRFGFCIYILCFSAFLLGLCKQKLNKFPVQWLCGRWAIYKSSISQAQSGAWPYRVPLWEAICIYLLDFMLKLLSCLLFCINICRTLAAPKSRQHFAMDCSWEENFIVFREISLFFLAFWLGNTHLKNHTQICGKRTLRPVAKPEAICFVKHIRKL